MSEKEIKSAHVPVMSVGKMANLLAASYAGVLASGHTFKSFPSVMLWGAPGVGKSQGVRQIGKKLEAMTGKKAVITDVRLLLFNPIDLRGIPVANEDRTLAIWLKPKIFQMDPSEDVINILFLDEISAAPQSVQAAAYQITLDRVVGEHQLPDNCIVIAAGNRVTDKSVSYKMPKALANRLLHIEIDGSYESWNQWAFKAGIHPLVVGFLAFRPNLLFGFDAASDALAFATPRSWEMVSNILNFVNSDLDQVYPLVAGLLGTGTALAFRTWADSVGSLPSMKDVFEGKPVTVPKKVDLLYALVSAMCGYAKDHLKDLDLIANSLRFAKGLPADFIELLLEEYRTMEPDYDETLKMIPEYMEIARRGSVLRNGSVR